MATITGLTAARMLEIEGASVIDGEVIDGELILTKHDGTTINAGPVAGPPGPTGPMGPASVGAIPGEVRLWPGTVLPLEATYGKWVWADGQDYANADHPKAAAHIAVAWKTFDGANSPGDTTPTGRFRVPDLRGLSPVGLDQMPGGSRGRANRLTRATSIIIATKTGKEVHAITLPEMPPHAHSVEIGVADEAQNNAPNAPVRRNWAAGAQWIGGAFRTLSEGNGNSHENMQPSAMVPWIVHLDVV